ncbi:MAG: histidinol-phosphatase, partial [Lachnospiraceae bacterium]|nr:histidinol-phosphatase [Lachnospiraceae bacterium]
DLERKEIFSIAQTDYVLVEFRTSSEYDKIRNALRSFQERGYKPILAHVERYMSLLSFDILHELKELGIVIQMNTESFVGNLFHKESRFCIRAAKLGLVDILGSDCHDLKYRAPMMQKAISKLEKALTSEELGKILFDNPKALLQNKYL